MRRRRIALRSLLVLLAASILLPLAISAGVGLYLLDAHHRSQTRRLAIETARALGTAVDAELSRSISVLETLAGVDALNESDLARFHMLARRVVQTQPGWLMIGLAQPDGMQVLSTRAELGARPLAVVEPDSLQMAVRSRAPVVGFLRRGSGGTYAIPVRVPVLAGGDLRYVLTGVIRPDAILDVVRRQNVRADWAISVFDGRGARVARSRAHELALGTAPSSSLQKLGAAAPEGWGLTHTLEGEAVYTAYSRSPTTGWMVAVGVPSPLLREGWTRTLAAYGAGLLMSFGVGLIASVLLARRVTVPMASLRAAARTLARREVPIVAASQVAEIDDVGGALVAAGEERARVEAQRERLLAAEQEARATAERANSFKDEFVSMLSHELRNPIAAIVSAARLLESGEVEPSVVSRARAVIRRQALQLEKLADDLLAAEAALQGRIVLERRSVDLAAAAGEALANAVAAGTGSAHRVETDLQPVGVHADPVRLAQIIARLLDNAFKFTPEGGTVRIATRAERTEGVLSVADTGIGMSTEVARRVFELRPPLPGDPQAHRSGLGIGLALVRRLTELHGGSVSARSAGPGKGAEFEVRLPQASAVQAEAVPPPAPEPTQHARHVVLVEDNDDARAMLSILLRTAGHRVRAARDGVEGLQAILDEPPEVALVDIGLPKLDGYEVARRVHEALGAGQRPFLIAVTGYGAPADKQRAMAAGFDLHLVKPVDYSALESAFARLP